MSSRRYKMCMGRSARSRIFVWSIRKKAFSPLSTQSLQRKTVTYLICYLGVLGDLCGKFGFLRDHLCLVCKKSSGYLLSCLAPLIFRNPVCVPKFIKVRRPYRAFRYGKFPAEAKEPFFICRYNMIRLFSPRKVVFVYGYETSLRPGYSVGNFFQGEYFDFEMEFAT